MPVAASASASPASPSSTVASRSAETERRTRSSIVTNPWIGWSGSSARTSRLTVRSSDAGSSALRTMTLRSR